MATSRPSHGRWARALVAVTASLSLVVGIIGAASAVRWVHLRGVGTDAGSFHPAVPSGSLAPPTSKCSERPCNYLLIGSDSRKGLPNDEQHQFDTNQDIGGTNRADTIMLVHTDPALQKAIVLSFPRDLWVSIPQHGYGKINTAFEGGLMGGGPQLIADTVAKLTDLTVDHYLYVDLNGFRQVVDTLGGVDVCIPAYDVNTPGWLYQHDGHGGETPIYYGEVGHVVDPNTGLNVVPGCQRLDGYQALAYVRTRSLPCDAIPDFSRIGRQQQFLRALINQMLRPSELAKAPRLIEPILANLHRDSAFLPGDLVFLVGQLRGLTTGAVEFRSVPGYGATVGTQSVVKMDPSAQQIFTAIRDGKQLGDIGTQLINTPPSEANTLVAVIDDGSGGRADEVEELLASAGFDVSPGVVQGSAPAGVQGSAVVFAPGHAEYARVVSGYLPGLPLIESGKLHGALVTVVVTPTYRPTPTGTPSPPASTTGCPTG
jgi:LCP family protein required for cell wall assembly